MRSRIAAAAVAAALAPMAAGAQSFPEVSFSGFGTLGVVRTDTDALQYATSVLQPGGAGNDFDFETDSLIAGQVNARFSPKPRARLASAGVSALVRTRSRRRASAHCISRS